MDILDLDTFPGFHMHLHTFRTVDLKRIKSEDDPLNGYFGRVLKYAYAELTHVSTGVKIRLGQHAVPWVGYSDKLLGKKHNHGVFTKVEKFDPNTDVDDDGNLRIIAGIYCEAAKGMTFALDYEAKSYEAEGKDTAGAIALHTQIKF